MLDASFTIPKLMPVGPTFILHAEADAEYELAVLFEKRVGIASWEFQQTYPDDLSRRLIQTRRATGTQSPWNTLSPISI